jgi:hypothetical protein
MSLYLLTIALIMGIAVLGIAVDRVYRGFARDNPQLGPFRDSDQGCGCCAAKDACGTGSCAPKH